MRSGRIYDLGNSKGCYAYAYILVQITLFLTIKEGCNLSQNVLPKQNLIAS